MKYYDGIFPAGLKTTTTNLTQNSGCLGRDSNQASLEYKSESLQLQPSCPVPYSKKNAEIYLAKHEVCDIAKVAVQRQKIILFSF
jgi:hypothetical protein